MVVIGDLGPWDPPKLKGIGDAAKEHPEAHGIPNHRAPKNHQAKPLAD